MGDMRRALLAALVGLATLVVALPITPQDSSDPEVLVSLADGWKPFVDKAPKRALKPGRTFLPMTAKQFKLVLHGASKAHPWGTDKGEEAIEHSLQNAENVHRRSMYMARVHEENVKARKAKRLRKLEREKELKDAPKVNPMWPLGSVTTKSFRKRDTSLASKRRWNAHQSDLGESRSPEDSGNEQHQDQLGEDSEYDPVQDMLAANGWSRGMLTDGQSNNDVGEGSETATNSNAESGDEEQTHEGVGEEEGSSESTSDSRDKQQSSQAADSHERSQHNYQEKEHHHNNKKKHHTSQSSIDNDDLGESDDNEGELTSKQYAQQRTTKVTAAPSSGNAARDWTDTPNSIAIHHKNEQGVQDLLGDPTDDEVNSP